jgi:hypothetical protein
LRPSPDTAKGFDTDRTFMLVEIAGDTFNFQTISRTGETVDSGALPRQPKPGHANSQPFQVLADAREHILSRL